MPRRSVSIGLASNRSLASLNSWSSLRRSKNVSLEIELNKLAILPGALELAKQGFLTRANKTNREFSQSMLTISPAVNESLLQMAFDPQTSGGLLMSVPKKYAQGLVDAINAHDSSNACIVGSVYEKTDCALKLV